MVLKIPESPQRVSVGNVQQRSPTNIQAPADAGIQGVDNRPVVQALESVGATVVDIVKKQEDALFTGVQNSYNEHMSKIMLDKKRSVQGKNSIDFYRNQIAPESDKYLEKLLSAPDSSSDPVTHISDPGLQSKFREWVASNQSTLISQSAAYEGSELQKWENSEYEAADIYNSNLN